MGRFKAGEIVRIKTDFEGIEIYQTFDWFKALLKSKSLLKVAGGSVWSNSIKCFVLNPSPELLFIFGEECSLYLSGSQIESVTIYKEV